MSSPLRPARMSDGEFPWTEEDYARCSGLVSDCFCFYYMKWGTYYVKMGSCTSSSGKEEEEEEKHPRRPGDPNCAHYMRFGSCKYGISCKFNHPPKQDQDDFVRRWRGVPDCFDFVRIGSCKYGRNCRFNHPHPNQVKINFLGLPLRPGRRECLYYMRSGFCKYGSNCKFHHPEPKSDHQNCGRSGIVPPQQVYPCPERSQFQAMPDCAKFRFAPPENVDLQNVMYGDVMDSSSTASEANLAVDTTVGSEQCSCDASDIGIIDKVVDKQSEVTNLEHAALNQVNFADKVNPINSKTSRRIDEVRCGISEIMELVTDAGAGEGSDEHFIATQLFIIPEYREMFLTLKTPQLRLAWLKRMYQEKKK